MTKQELITNAAGIMDIPLSAVVKIIDAALETIVDAVSKGDTVTIPGFGTFSRRQKDAGTGRNPKTGETIIIPAHGMAVFKPGKRFKDAVK